MSLLGSIKKVINRVENSRVPFFYFLLTFFFAVTLRNFLEVFLFCGDVVPDIFSHFYLSYVCIAMSVIILFHFATGEKIKKISRVILAYFLIVLIVPVVDLIASFLTGTVYNITYLTPGQHGNLLLRFLTFFGPLDQLGITPGIRVQVGLLVLGSFVYFFAKNRNVVRSLFFSFLTYCLMFFYGIFPFAAETFLKVFGLKPVFSQALMINSYLLLALMLGVCLFYLYKKEYFMEILGDIRIFRLLHLESMFVFGAAFAQLAMIRMDFLPEFQVTQDILFYIVFMMVSVAFAWLFSVVINNITDVKIDRVTNRTRPTVTGKIPMEIYKKFAWIFFLLAMVYSAAVGFTGAFLVLLFMAVCFMCSMPPLRLKRVFLLSKLLMSFNCMVLFVTGYFFVYGSMRIPFVILIFFLVFLTAVISFIDIKDYRGDRKAGIKTLPVVLGLKRSKIVIGLSFLAAYLALCLLTRDVYLAPFLVALGLAQFYLVNRKNYSEAPVIILFLFSNMGLVLYAMLNFLV